MYLGRVDGFVLRIRFRAVGTGAAIASIDIGGSLNPIHTKGVSHLLDRFLDRQKNNRF